MESTIIFGACVRPRFRLYLFIPERRGGVRVRLHVTGPHPGTEWGAGGSLKTIINYGFHAGI